MTYQDEFYCCLVFVTFIFLVVQVRVQTFLFHYFIIFLLSLIEVTQEERRRDFVSSLLAVRIGVSERGKLGGGEHQGNIILLQQNFWGYNFLILSNLFNFRLKNLKHDFLGRIQS